MSAGTGVMHSEFNHAKDQETHLLQIWIEPDAMGVEPSYEQRRVPDEDKRGRLCRLAAPRDALVRIHADATLYAGCFDAQEQATLPLAPGRKGYVHLVRGALRVNGQSLRGGDALLLDNEPAITLDQGQDAEVLVFDLMP